MATNRNDEFDPLRRQRAPNPDADAKRRALDAALSAYDTSENLSAAPQGSLQGERLTDRTIRFWREIMQKKLIATPALAGLVALPVAGVVTWQLMDEYRISQRPHDAVVETSAPKRPRLEAQSDVEVADRSVAIAPQAVMPPASPMMTHEMGRAVAPAAGAKLMAQPAPMPEPGVQPQPDLLVWPPA